MDTNSLAELKNIHLPPAVSVLPLAPGFYILAVLIILITAVIVWWQIARYKHKRQISKILTLLDQIEQQAGVANTTLSDVSILLKRIAMLRFPEQRPQQLFGDKWLEFLNTTGKTTQFTQGAGRCLSDVYKPGCVEQPEAFFALIRDWLRTVL